MNVLDKQIGGDHYKKFGHYQPWEVFPHWLTPEELLGFAKATAMVYLIRKKAGREDIEKALHTLELYLEVTKKKEEVKHGEIQHGKFMGMADADDLRHGLYPGGMLRIHNERRDASAPDEQSDDRRGAASE